PQRPVPEPCCWVPLEARQHLHQAPSHRQRRATPSRNEQRHRASHRQYTMRHNRTRREAAMRYSNESRNLSGYLAALLLVVLAAPVGAQTDKGPPRVRNVYIPQQELEAIFGEGNKGALLTRDEFQALWTKAGGELPEA